MDCVAEEDVASRWLLIGGCREVSGKSFSVRSSSATLRLPARSIDLVARGGAAGPGGRVGGDRSRSLDGDF